MGCCASTFEENKTKQQKNHQFSSVSKSPPTPDEELVKEVLSETPKPEIIVPNCDSDPEPDICKHFVSPKKPFLGEKWIPEEEISEVSVVCSVSESISNNAPGDSGEVHQRVYTSQGYNSNFVDKNINGSDHNVLLRCHGRSPVRRADPSPPRRCSGRVGLRRDVTGENSARRSQSPAARSNVDRTPSGRRTAPSPGRVRMVHGPDEMMDEWAGPRESLENPLVSLECFIFL
ncbi:hypothetical protein RND81_07G143800 [Saponaria officinalis]|uniref:Uncharacterized protein n=1 Tax=Saponaria officinalis TaxID=3572 RepID=A0AAW1JNC9_SAPOF